MTALQPDKTYRDVTGDRFRLAGDVFEDGRQYRPEDAAKCHDALAASMAESWRNAFLYVFNKP